MGIGVSIPGIRNKLDFKSQFDYPADPSLSTSDVGKLLRDNGSGSAIVYQRIQATPTTVQATINSPGRVEVAQADAHFKLFFVSNPSEGDPCSIVARPGSSNNRTFFRWVFTTGSTDTNADPVKVHIGATVTDTISNLLAILNNSDVNGVLRLNYMLPAVSNVGMENSISITATGQMSGAVGNVINGNPTRISGFQGSFDPSAQFAVFDYNKNAKFNIVFHSQPAVDDIVSLQACDGGGCHQAYFKFVSGSPGVHEVQIGSTLADTIANVVTYLRSQPVAVPNDSSSYVSVTNNGDSSITVQCLSDHLPSTAGNATSGDLGLFISLYPIALDGDTSWEHPPGPTSSPWLGPGGALEITGDNLFFNVTSGTHAQFGAGDGGEPANAPFLNPSGTLEWRDVIKYQRISSPPPPIWDLGPNNGLDHVTPSEFRFSDTFFGPICDVKAGVDWTPTGDAASEAAAILAAIQAAVTAAGWSVLRTDNVLNFTCNTLGPNATSLDDPSGSGFLSPSVNNGTDPSSPYIPLGKLLSLSGSVARIAFPTGQRLTTDGVVNQGDYLAGGIDGRVRTTANFSDFIVGRALNTAADGVEIDVGYAPNNLTLWTDPPPRSPEAAIDRIASWIVGNVGGPL